MKNNFYEKEAFKQSANKFLFITEKGVVAIETNRNVITPQSRAHFDSNIYIRITKTIETIMILIDTIRKEINKWNPIGLFDSYFPPDEYESEIRDIFNITSGRKIDEDELGRIIFGVFIYYFDTTFISSIQECIEIAREILNQSE